jgi:hypothetical protein
MLAAVEDEGVIVGAYIDRAGRVCPMLAAHRRGARTEARRFARAWDAFGGARRPRLATEREREILVALLQESLGGDDGDRGATVPPHRTPDHAEPFSVNLPA